MMRCMKGHEFKEGIRALLIDKDNKPQWSPEKLEDISNHYIDSFFEPLGEYELNVF